MTAIRAKFDGNQIEVPPELRDAAPREVLIVFEEQRDDQGRAARGSIWDAFGKAQQPREAAELDARLREERDSWGER